MEEIGHCDTPGQAGKYELAEKIGNGYLGPVYRAMDRGSGRTVAVRLFGGIRQLDSAAKALVLSGCATLTTIQHPNIVPVLEAGEDRGLLYVVTEFVEGCTLEPCFTSRQATLEQKLSLMVQAAEGFAQAHQSGVLHCDFRPSKAVVTARGVLRIRDLGLSRMLPRYQSRPSVKWGKPIYLSPEQIEGSPCTPSSDIFSAGIVFQEFLTGVHPFQGENGHHTLDRILRENPQRFEEVFPDAPRSIGKLLRRCLEKEPDARFVSMADVAAGVRDILREMAEDSQVMLSDLLESLRLLKAAAGRETAPAALRSLRDDVQRLATSGGPAGYVALESLTNRLFEQYPLLQDVSCDEPDGELDELVLAVEAPAASTNPQVEPAPAPASAGSDAPKAPPDLPELPPAAEAPPCVPRPSNVGETVPEPSDKPAPSPSVQPPPAVLFPTPAASAEVKTPPRKGRLVLTKRSLRPSLSRAAGLLAVLLTLVAAYILRNGGPTGAGWPFGASGQAEASVADLPTRAGPDAPAPGMNGTGLDVLSGDVRTEVLVREAQDLSVSGRDMESRVLLKRALEISPGHEKAQALLDLLTPSREADPPSSPDPTLVKALGTAGSLLESGNLAAAKTAIDRLQRQFPDEPDVRALRRKWEARNAKALKDEARREEEKKEAARNKERLEEEWSGRIQAQILEGKYSEARGAISLWLSQDPGNLKAQNLGGRLNDAEKAVRSCEESLGGKRFQEAVAALATVERLSPSHPQIGELRRRAEQARANAKGMLTVHRLGLRGSLLLDGKPLGAGDEIANEAVPAGVHSLSVRGEGGTTLSAKFELYDGQKADFVYDVKRKLLRPMADGDRERLDQRRVEEETQSFALEHSHGVFRGSCKGELLLNVDYVEFRPASGPHKVQFPLSQLEFRMDSRSISLVDKVAERELCSFKVPDPARAEQIKKTWERLQTLAKRQAAADETAVAR